MSLAVLSQPVVRTGLTGHLSVLWCTRGVLVWENHNSLWRFTSAWVLQRVSVGVVIAICSMHDVFIITQTSESTEWCPRMSRALILILAPAGFRVFLVYHSWIWINPFNQMLWICAFNFNSQIPQTILAEPEPIKKRLGMFFFLLETLWLHWRRIFRCYRHKKQSQQIDRDGRCWLFPKLLFPIPMTPVARDTICDHLQILIPLFIFASYTSVFNAKSFDENTACSVPLGFWTPSWSEV